VGHFRPDLLVEVSGTSRRSGLEDALRSAIRGGRLAAGQLGFARNTVADAYGQLVAEGYLVARQGSGTRVTTRAPLARPPARAATPPPTTPVRAYDLVPGRPDLAGFPRSAWLAAARRALMAAPADTLGYPDPRGLPVLREQLVDYLARVRAVRTTAERIVVCSGYGQALHLLASVLHREGARSIAVESYGISYHREIIRAAGPRCAGLPIDEHGAVIEHAGDAAAMVLTPGHQFPLGVPLSAARREDAVAWAAVSGGVVVEDDYDGEFRYDRRPLGAVQGLDPDRVAYVGTASKSLAPGVHLAWLVVPPRLLDAVVQAKRVSDGFTGTLEQLTLAELISSGAYDRHVRSARLRYRRRRDRLVSRLAAERPGGTVTGIAAGLHAVVTLTGALRAADEPALVSRAARTGLAVTGLDGYRMRSAPDSPAALVIGYGTPPEHAYGRALELLCEVLT